MTRSELEAITRGLAPVMREYTARAVAEVRAENEALRLRVVELESRRFEPPTAGEKGDPGAGVASIVVTADGRLLVHLTDGRTVDAGPVPMGPPGPPGAPGRDGIDAKGIESPAAPEAVPGPPGAPGEPGAPGAGIASVAVTAAGRLLVHLTDGRSLDAGPLPAGPPGPQGEPGPVGRGEKGDKGDPGVGEPGPPGPIGRGEKGDKGDPGRGVAFVDAVDGWLVATFTDGGRERVGALPVGPPGPSGPPGPVGRGEKGEKGDPGADGLGIDDSALVFDEALGYRIRWSRGDRVKDQPIAAIFDAGVWTEGKSYPAGASVSWDGGTWHAKQVTSAKPGDDADAWRLASRRGKQGREGRPGKDGAPGRDLTQMDFTGKKW